MIIQRLAAFTLSALLLTAAAAYAHEAAKGRNGGMRVDAGAYHAELVVDGGTTVTVYLTDEADKPVAVTGVKANAIFVVGAQPVRFGLAAADATKLTGTAPVAIPADAKGVIQFVMPDGKTTQAKY